MDPAIFEELESTLATAGPKAALERLCARLCEQHDYDGLFHARLLARRHELGIPLVPANPGSDVPDDKKDQFDETIARVCREVGELHLKQGNFGQAYGYFRVLEDVEPVRQALLAHEPGEDESADQIVQLAFYEGLAPRKGFDWVIGRFGLCSAITNLSNQQLPISPEDRRYCVQRVVRTLYEELRGRLAADIESHEGKLPPEASAPPGEKGVVRRMLKGRESLFGEDAYHVDLSHLFSAVQMSLELEPCDELDLARELCDYGSHLAPGFRSDNDPPFDEPYRDQDVFLSILAGDNVEAGIAHFRAKAEKGAAEEDPRPAEVLVQLLLRLGRTAEALEIGAKYLSPVDSPWLSFTADLCRRANDFSPLAEAARKQGNPVQFVAGLLATERK
jgi:hypothetical protein